MENPGDLDLDQIRQLWPSAWQEDETDYDEFTQEEIDNDPKKRILWASEMGHEDIVQGLVESDPSLVSTRDSDLYTPLHRASYNNHMGVAKVLLSHNADVTARTQDGWTPLHSAARWNSVETAEALLASGADINATTNGGLTPLHMAASERGNARMVVFLLSCPFIDVNARSNAGETARTICERCSPFYELFDMVDSCVNELRPTCR